MHYVVIPKPIPITNASASDGSTPSLTLPDFVAYHLATSKLWRQRGWSGNLKALVDLFEKKNPGDVVALEDDVYEQLVRVAQAHDFPELLARFCVELVHVLLEAPRERPQSATSAEGSGRKRR